MSMGKEIVQNVVTSLLTVVIVVGIVTGLLYLGVKWVVSNLSPSDILDKILSLG